MNPMDASPPERTPTAGSHLFILSAPSGTGKTTLGNALRTRMPDLAYSVSYTTRAPRTGERPGVDYHFIPIEAFEARIRENRWAEWARVHDHYYGTSADDLRQLLDAGRDVLLDIDVQGAAQIAARFPECVTVFIMPPSMDALRQRLLARGTDSAASMEKRLKNAEAEIAARHRYHHVLVNDDLAKATAELVALVEGYRSPRGQ